MLVPSAKSQGVVFRRVVNKKSDKKLKGPDGLQFFQGDGLEYVQGLGLHFHQSITGISFLGSPWIR